MIECHNCDKPGAEFDCNGLKFCDENCFYGWDHEDDGNGFYGDPEENEIDKAIDDCGIGPDGSCRLAGTEHCDFECPFRDGGHPMLDMVEGDS